MYAETVLKEWMEAQEPMAPKMKDGPAFFRNLEQSLDVHRATHSLLLAKPRWDDSIVDLTTSDALSLNRDGIVRDALLKELQAHGDFILSASGSRVQYGNYEYLIQTEKEIAEFHGAETAYIAHSGFMANASAVAAIGTPGDVYVYDELVHTSSHDGMKLSQVAEQIKFKHNDVESLRDVLTNLRDTNPKLKAGTKNVIILVESIYSMDGDVCPLKECVAVAKEIFPLGNAQFVIDEAHSTGVIGPQGRGLVNMLGLEKEIAVRIHMCSKALASTGGVILCNKHVRNALIQNARFFVYSGSPSFAMVASMRVGYQQLMSGATMERQEQVQRVVKHFYKTMQEHPVYEEAVEEGIISIPPMEDWESRKWHTHIVPIRTRNHYEKYLFYHVLLIAKMNAYAWSFPIVPKGQSRLRIVFHNHNTFKQVEDLVNAICDWAQEMLDIESGSSDTTLPEATRQVYALQGITS
ncbi:5-aminolevulinate synthase [Biscogniauxia sp. FL1348]|nr:5-aminolevulinate synthase [Biscogniauxia sp. FL1348]